jgi:hypothetical protein
MWPAQALVVQPALVDVQVDPGKGDVKYLKITNDDVTSATYEVTIQKFVPKGENGQQDFLPSTDTSGLPEWMYVDKPELTLAPGQSANLQVAFRVPTDAAPGGYYAALFLSQRQPPDAQLGVLPRLGVLFFVRVNGQASERLVLTQFASDADSYSSLPVGFHLLIANEGAVHEQPVGTITIKNIFGTTVASLPANPDANRILPQSSHTLLAVWKNGNFAIGPYTATVTFSGPGFSGDEVRVVHFSVWPWRTLGEVLGLLMLVMIGFFILKKVIIKQATSAPKI